MAVKGPQVANSSLYIVDCPLEMRKMHIEWRRKIIISQEAKHQVRIRAKKIPLLQKYHPIDKFARGTKNKREKGQESGFFEKN